LRELALHLLDIAHNSVSAHARNITIAVEENTVTDRLTLSVGDDGIGMDAVTVQRVTDPFVTSRKTRNVGLGIPLLKAAAEMCGGSLVIHSIPGVGTRIDVDFERSNIDRMPLGSLAETILSLVVGCPDVHWIFRYKADEQIFEFDDAPIKQELVDIPLSEPEVLSYLRELLESGVSQLQESIQAF
jgi:hypothetical protein